MTIYIRTRNFVHDGDVKLGEIVCDEGNYYFVPVEDVYLTLEDIQEISDILETEQGPK